MRRSDFPQEPLSRGTVAAVVASFEYSRPSQWDKTPTVTTKKRPMRMENLNRFPPGILIMSGPLTQLSCTVGGYGP